MSATGEVADADQLSTWHEGLPAMIERVRKRLGLRDNADAYAMEALDALERLVLKDAAAPEPSADLARAAAGYLGEALLTAGGGRWVWDADIDLPVVQPDEGVAGRSNPFALVSEAGTERTFRAALQQMRDGVTRRRRTRGAEWLPIRTDDPAPTRVTYSQAARHPWLAGWLDDRGQGFAAWTAETAPGGDGWDFSPESLDALERVVRERLQSESELAQDDHQDLVAGAQWYVGEIFRRHGDAHWSYHAPGAVAPADPPDDNPPDDNPFVGNPYVVKDPPSTSAAVPMVELQALFWSDEAGAIRQTLNNFID